jgi:uncharacterized membrane protein YphA (DoxX/SURF4 family)
MGSIDHLHDWANRQPLLRVFTLIVRVLLATAFVPSGLVKILDHPFTTLPTTDPVGYFFAGFFSAHGFYRFVGVAQWLAAALLLIPRTATLGACLYLPIITNIFVITVAIGPAFAFTRVITGMMLMGAIYLLFWDWDRWKHILPFTRPAPSRHGDLLTVVGLLVAAVVGFQSVAAAHLARLRHTALAVPLSGIAIGAAIGVAMLVRAYKHARLRD